MYNCFKCPLRVQLNDQKAFSQLVTFQKHMFHVIHKTRVIKTIVKSCLYLVQHSINFKTIINLEKALTNLMVTCDLVGVLSTQLSQSFFSLKAGRQAGGELCGPLDGITFLWCKGFCMQ